MTSVIIGASSGLGRALAAQLAARGDCLLLVASDKRDVDALAADLALRFGVDARGLAIDLGQVADPGAPILQCLSDMRPLSALVLCAGYSRDDDNLSLDALAIGQLLAINLHAPLAIAHRLLPDLLENDGVIVGFGSIAAARGRRHNAVYASAKRGLESFFQSLRQAYPPPQLRVQFHRPGFMHSNLTWGKTLPLPAADVGAVAARVVTAMARGSFARYQPRWWGLVALLLRLLPWPVFRRLRN